MAKNRLNHEILVDGAVELVNQRGVDSLSLAELAARFRVRSPSLYNHVEGLAGLRHDVALRGLNLLTARIRPAIAGLSGRDALHAAALAYREFALENPGVYGCLFRSVESGGQEFADASRELDDLIIATLRGYKLPSQNIPHGVRLVRSVLHGFVSQELASVFSAEPPPHESYLLTIEGMDEALKVLSRNK